MSVAVSQRNRCFLSRAHFTTGLEAICCIIMTAWFRFTRQVVGTGTPNVRLLPWNQYLLAAVGDCTASSEHLRYCRNEIDNYNGSAYICSECWRFSPQSPPSRQQCAFQNHPASPTFQNPTSPSTRSCWYDSKRNAIITNSKPR